MVNITKNIKSVLKNIYVGLFPIIILLASVLYKEAELSYQQLEGSKHILVGVLYLICFLLLTSIIIFYNKDINNIYVIIGVAMNTIFLISRILPFYIIDKVYSNHLLLTNMILTSISAYILFFIIRRRNIIK